MPDDDTLQRALEFAERFLDDEAVAEEHLTDDDLVERGVLGVAAFYTLADGWLEYDPDDRRMRTHLLAEEGAPPELVGRVLTRMRELGKARGFYPAPTTGGPMPERSLPTVPHWLRELVDEAVSALEQRGEPVTVEAIAYGERRHERMFGKGTLPDLVRIAVEVALLDREHHATDELDDDERDDG